MGKSEPLRAKKKEGFSPNALVSTSIFANRFNKQSANVTMRRRYFQKKKMTNLYDLRIVSIDPGQVNISGILMKKKKGFDNKNPDSYVVTHLGLYDLYEKSLNGAMENVNVVFDRDVNLQTELASNSPNHGNLEVIIESQEGFSHSKNPALAIVLVRMSHIAGAIYEYFKSKNVKVKFVSKRSKWLNGLAYSKSSIRTCVMDFLTRNKQTTALKFLSDNSQRKQHCMDVISAALKYGISKKKGDFTRKSIANEASKDEDRSVVRKKMTPSRHKKGLKIALGSGITKKRKGKNASKKMVFEGILKKKGDFTQKSIVDVKPTVRPVIDVTDEASEDEYCSVVRKKATPESPKSKQRHKKGLKITLDSGITKKNVKARTRPKKIASSILRYFK